MPRADRETWTKSTHTRARVAFFTDDANGFNTDQPVEGHPRLGRIVGVSTSKKLGSASGTFTITVKKDETYHGPRSLNRDLWRDPEDVWVLIQFVVDGKPIDTILGLIDNVHEASRRSGQGARDETYTIVGRDIGKVFETIELFVNIYQLENDAVRSQASLVQAFGERVVGTPAHFVRLLLEEWIGNNGQAAQQYVLPAGLGGGWFRQILQTTEIEPMSRLVHGEAIAPTLFQIDQTTGKLWDVMQEYSNGALNEMFVDLAPPSRRTDRQDFTRLRPTFFLRERPFPTRSNGRTVSTRWDRLPTHDLELGDVRNRDIAKGGAANRYNYWLITLSGLGSDGFNVAELLQRGVEGVEYGRPGNIPIFNVQSIQRHGLRRYAADTRYIPYQSARRDAPQADQEQFLRLAASWLKKIHDWYVVAPLELSGSLTLTRVMPEIRIGQRVREHRAEGEIVYYCEGVDHTYQYPNAGSTRLTLTRGEYEGDDLLEYVYDTYEHPRALTAREACMIPLDVDLTDAEIDDYLAQGCRVSIPATSRAQVAFESGLASGAVEEGTGFTVTEGPRTLQVERDGTVPYEDPEGPASLALDSSDPNVGTEDEIPSPNETAPEPGDPVLDQQGLERGEPIETSDEGFDATINDILGDS